MLLVAQRQTKYLSNTLKACKHLYKKSRLTLRSRKFPISLAGMVLAATHCACLLTRSQSGWPPTRSELHQQHTSGRGSSGAKVRVKWWKWMKRWNQSLPIRPFALKLDSPISPALRVLLLSHRGTGRNLGAPRREKFCAPNPPARPPPSAAMTGRANSTVESGPAQVREQ